VRRFLNSRMPSRLKVVGHGATTLTGYLNQDHRMPQPRNTENMNTKIDAQQTLGKLMGEFLATAKPTGTRTGQKWLDQDEAQRAACSRLWAQCEAAIDKLSNVSKSEKMISKPISRSYLLISLPEHISAVQKEHAEFLAKITAKKSEKTAKKTPPKAEIQIQWGSGAQGEHSASAQEAKVKIKTRSDKPVEESLEDLAVLDNDDEPPQPKVAVSKRSLETLQSLYPKPSGEERTKKVDWASFVLAMAEAGFAARQNHGSRYSFEPIPTCK
jgi:hypothetical protein